MGFLRKKFKQVKKGIKKLGSVFSKALDKLGIGKVLGKLGPLGSLAIMFAMPYLGAWWSGLGAASPATTFIGQVGQTLHKVASSVGNVVLSPVKAINGALKAFAPTRDLVTNATNLFKDAHNFVAEKLGISKAFPTPATPATVTEAGGISFKPGDAVPMSEDTRQLFKDIKATNIDLSNSPLLRNDVTLNDIVNPAFKGPATDNFLLNQRSSLGSASILEDTFYKDPVNLYGTNLEGNIPIKANVQDYISKLPTDTQQAATGLLDITPKGKFEAKLGKLAGKNIDWSNVNMEDFGDYIKGLPNLTPNDLASLVTDKNQPLGKFFGDTRTGTIWQTHNMVSAALRDPEMPYNPGVNPYAGGLLANEMSKIDTTPVYNVSGQTGWNVDMTKNTSMSSGNYGFHPNNVFTYDMFGDTYNLHQYGMGYQPSYTEPTDEFGGF